MLAATAQARPSGERCCLKRVRRRSARLQDETSLGRWLPLMSALLLVIKRANSEFRSRTPYPQRLHSISTNHHTGHHLSTRCGCHSRRRCPYGVTPCTQRPFMTNYVASESTPTSPQATPTRNRRPPRETPPHPGKHRLTPRPTGSHGGSVRPGRVQAVRRQVASGHNPTRREQPAGQDWVNRSTAAGLPARSGEVRLHLPI
jgi:hypothetical protein